MPTLKLDGERNAPELRQYQTEALDKITAASQRGVRRQLGVAATGLGKTIIFCSLAQRMNTKTLVLAHRDELIQQAADKVRWCWPDGDVGIVKAKDNDVGAQIVVASVQTLARERRLHQLPQDFGLVIVDEAHHAAATSYKTVLDYFGCGTDGGPLLVGVTATPDRGDGKGLDEQFDEIVFSFDILWGIRAGFLSDLRGKQVVMEHLDLRGVKRRGGDYNEAQLGDALEAADAPGHVARAYVEFARDRKTIVFTPTIALAQETADELKLLGVTAASVSGVDLDERRRILHDFHTGAISVVTNCAVLTEGYDEPTVDCIVVARPTQSRALYVQMVGRGTRRHPDKTDCLVLDVVGATSQHELVTIPSLFGLGEDPKVRDGEKTVTQADDERLDELVRQGALKAQDVELFHRLREAGLNWIRTGGKYAVSVGRETLLLERDDADRDLWTARVLGEAQRGQAPPVRVLMADVALEVAQGVGEDYVRKHGKTHLVDPKAEWRQRPPSERALAAAAKWRVKHDGHKLGDCDECASFTAGQVSELIDAKAAEVKLRNLAAPPKRRRY